MESEVFTFQGVPSALVEHFDAWSTVYDETVSSHQGPYAEVFRGYWNILERLVDLVLPCPNATKLPLVLDIGTGTGNLAKVCLAKGLRVEAVDPSPAMRAEAARKLPGVRVLPGHFLSLPYPEATFDAVVSSFALHHVPLAQLPVAFREVRRILKKGGVAAIADVAFSSQVDRAHRIYYLLSTGNHLVLEDLRREYIPIVSRLVSAAREAGLSCQAEQITEWVWLYRLSIEGNPA